MSPDEAMVAISRADADVVVGLLKGSLRTDRHQLAQRIEAQMIRADLDHRASGEGGQPSAAGAERHPVMIISRKHPHYARRGTIDVCDGKVLVAHLAGAVMVRVDFTDGKDPEAAFAERGEIAPVRP